MPTILITLATGQQGRATIAALLESGAKVRAVVRDPTNEAARALAAKGVTLFKGSNDDFGIFREAAAGCDAIFLNILPFPVVQDPVKQAIGILGACKEAGVPHVVLSSAGLVGARDKWDVPVNQSSGLAEYYRHEAAIEDAARSSGIASLTILRPYWFHSNYTPPAGSNYYPELLAKGEFVHSLRPGVIFPHINVDDLGRFSAKALLDPAGFGGQEIELASENIALEDVVEAFRKATGRDVTLRTRTEAEEQPENAAAAVRWELWARTVDLSFDVEALKRKYDFKFTTLEEYFTQQKSKLAAPV